MNDTSSKHFTEGELAAEYWRERLIYVNSIHRPTFDYMESLDRTDTLARFAALPHALAPCKHR